MTTVAYKDGKLAADKRISIHNAEVSKAFRDDDGNLYGVIGKLAPALMVVEWLMGRADKPNPFEEDDSFYVLMVEKATGQIFMFDYFLHALPIESKFFALGSGSSYAMGAMAQGASAKKAVEIASLFDDSTGSGVEVLVL